MSRNRTSIKHVIHNVHVNERNEQEDIVNGVRAPYLYMKGCDTCECGTTHFIHVHPTFSFTSRHFTLGDFGTFTLTTVRFTLDFFLGARFAITTTGIIAYIHCTTTSIIAYIHHTLLKLGALRV